MRMQLVCAIALTLFFGMVSVGARRRLPEDRRILRRRPGDPQHRRLPGAPGLLALSIAIQLRLAGHER
jgi:hypothetical protein